MDILVWVWWLVSTLLWAVFALLWFLVSGWVSTLLQIGLLIAAVYFLKYGWQRAPAEIWRRSRTFGRFFLNWVRAREPELPASISPKRSGGTGGKGQGVWRYQYLHPALVTHANGVSVGDTAVTRLQMWAWLTWTGVRAPILPVAWVLAHATVLLLKALDRRYIRASVM